MTQREEIKGGFHAVLRKSIHEGIQSVVGRETVVSVEFYLDSSMAEKNIVAYTQALEKMFREGAKLIEQRIAQALYFNFQLDFHLTEGNKLNAYVEDAKKKWLLGESSRNQ
jgi:hypothetical protein